MHYNYGMKGIILAGGTGSRLWPITKSISKQLAPVYDKPMIYYPISTLMLAKIRDILIITTPEDQESFKRLLKDGSDFGINISYEIQELPLGLAQAFTIGKNFINGNSCVLILGDNIFHGVGLGVELSKFVPHSGARIFTYEVSNPHEYGVLEVDLNGHPISITEKPKNSTSNLAITGLYFFDDKVCKIAKKIEPSLRGELEITSILSEYLKNNELSVTQLSRGTAWLDTGNADSMHEASSFVRIVEQRTGLKIGCPEEIAYNNGWISKNKLSGIAKSMIKSPYGNYLQSIVMNSRLPH